MEPDFLRPLHVLARAVVRQGSTILLARAQSYANTFLPGGHHELGESLKVSLTRELKEELGLEAQIGAYLGVVEHSYGDDRTTHYELNHLFEVSLPTLAEGEKPLSRETHLTFFWAELSELARHQLEPSPLRHLFESAFSASALLASTLVSSE